MKEDDIGLDRAEIETWHKNHGNEAIASRLAADAIDHLLYNSEPIWDRLHEWLGDEAVDGIWVTVEASADLLKDDLPDCMLHGNVEDCAAGDHYFDSDEDGDMGDAVVYKAGDELSNGVVITDIHVATPDEAYAHQIATLEAMLSGNYTVEREPNEEARDEQA